MRVYGDPVDRLPHLVCLGVDGVEPQAVLLGLDRAGVAAHSGSACSSEALEPSPVLEAMGVDAHHSLRLSVGWSTTEADVDAALPALPDPRRPPPSSRGGGLGVALLAEGVGVVVVPVRLPETRAHPARVTSSPRTHFADFQK